MQGGIVMDAPDTVTGTLGLSKCFEMIASIQCKSELARIIGIDTHPLPRNRQPAQYDRPAGYEVVEKEKYTMNYIALDFQKAYEYWYGNLYPYEQTSIDDDELIDWFDRWIAWLADSPLLDGTDIEYLYIHNARTQFNFDRFGLSYVIRDECGDEQNPIRWQRTNGNMAHIVEAADAEAH